HIASLSAVNTATSCVFWTLRVGGAEADPELPFFGSQKWRRGIIAAWTQKTSNCCDEWTIAP
ncbi:hypothetical protein FPK76_25580, partial [Acinetobacter baumannii]|nr:hypothetical protein [Acinetobacter baumannii]